MEAFSYAYNHPSFLADSVYFQHSPNELPLPPHHQLAAGEMSNGSSSCFTSYNSSDVEVLPSPLAKQTDGSCTSTGQSKDAKGSKSRRQKKAATGEKQHKAKELKAGSEDPLSGYIHVRARRGQATDSHSLAERVRRERISERMKKLQGLVPGCDKVIGKALVLDEIINYVQSLQNQVEFLSMKLASVNPVLYDFSADYNDEFVNHPEEMGGMSQPMPSLIQQIPPTAFGGAENNFQVVDSSAVPFSLQGQGPTNFSQDGCSFLMQVELNNMCSFH